VGCNATSTEHLNWVREKGIKVIDLKGETEFLNTICSTAEHAVGLMLALARNYKTALHSPYSDRESYKGHTLAGKNLGIIGYGRIGRQVAETTLTPALTVVATQYFISNLTKFYIDANYGAIGGTQKTDLLLKLTWTLETMFTPRYATDGALYFSAVNEDRKNVELELTYLRSTASELEKDKYDARSTTYLRIELLGATELDSGQSNPPYIYLDGAFRYTEWPETDDSDGMQTVKVTAQSVYDSVGAKEYGVAVFTNLAAYP